MKLIALLAKLPIFGIIAHSHEINRDESAGLKHLNDNSKKALARLAAWGVTNREQLNKQHQAALGHWSTHIENKVNQLENSGEWLALIEAALEACLRADNSEIVTKLSLCDNEDAIALFLACQPLLIAVACQHRELAEVLVTLWPLAFDLDETCPFLGGLSVRLALHSWPLSDKLKFLRHYQWTQARCKQQHLVRADLEVCLATLNENFLEFMMRHCAPRGSSAPFLKQDWLADKAACEAVLSQLLVLLFLSRGFHEDGWHDILIGHRSLVDFISDLVYITGTTLEVPLAGQVALFNDNDYLSKVFTGVGVEKIALALVFNGLSVNALEQQYQRAASLSVHQRAIIEYGLYIQRNQFFLPFERPEPLLDGHIQILAPAYHSESPLAQPFELLWGVDRRFIVPPDTHHSPYSFTWHWPLYLQQLPLADYLSLMCTDKQTDFSPVHTYMKQKGLMHLPPHTCQHGDKDCSLQTLYESYPTNELGVTEEPKETTRELTEFLSKDYQLQIKLSQNEAYRNPPKQSRPFRGKRSSWQDPVLIPHEHKPEEFLALALSYGAAQVTFIDVAELFGRYINTSLAAKKDPKLESHDTNHMQIKRQVEAFVAVLRELWPILRARIEDNKPELLQQLEKGKRIGIDSIEAAFQQLLKDFEDNLNQEQAALQSRIDSQRQAINQQTIRRHRQATRAVFSQAVGLGVASFLPLATQALGVKLSALQSQVLTKTLGAGISAHIQGEHHLIRHLLGAALAVVAPAGLGLTLDNELMRHILEQSLQATFESLGQQGELGTALSRGVLQGAFSALTHNRINQPFVAQAVNQAGVELVQSGKLEQMAGTLVASYVGQLQLAEAQRIGQVLITPDMKIEKTETRSLPQAQEAVDKTLFGDVRAARLNEARANQSVQAQLQALIYQAALAELSAHGYQVDDPGLTTQLALAVKDLVESHETPAQRRAFIEQMKATDIGFSARAHFGSYKFLTPPSGAVQPVAMPIVMPALAQYVLASVGPVVAGMTAQAAVMLYQDRAREKADRLEVAQLREAQQRKAQDAKAKHADQILNKVLPSGTSLIGLGLHRQLNQAQVGLDGKLLGQWTDTVQRNHVGASSSPAQVAASSIDREPRTSSSSLAPLTQTQNTMRSDLGQKLQKPYSTPISNPEPAGTATQFPVQTQNARDFILTTPPTQFTPRFNTYETPNYGVAGPIITSIPIPKLVPLLYMFSITEEEQQELARLETMEGGSEPWRPLSLKERVWLKVENCGVHQIKDFDHWQLENLNADESDMLDMILDTRYKSIRYNLRNDLIDLGVISESINLDRELVRKSFEHVFINKHSLDDGVVDRFAADYPMLRTFRNLIDGKLEGFEKRVIEHEVFEAYGETRGLNSREAHRAANEAGYTSGLNPREEEIYAEFKKSISLSELIFKKLHI